MAGSGLPLHWILIEKETGNRVEPVATYGFLGIDDWAWEVTHHGFLPIWLLDKKQPVTSILPPKN